MMVIDEAFKAGFNNQTNLFDQIMALQGDVFREMDGRRTLRIQHGGKSYFAKLHSGIGWKEIFKNLSQFKAPIWGAENEWSAIQKLDQLKVDTMKLVAYGRRGFNPAKFQSFVITEDLIDTTSLEDFCEPWKAQSPLSGDVLRLKRKLITRVAWMGKTMHLNGVNHRDFYLVHFLLNTKPSVEQLANSGFTVSIIDLHRVLISGETPDRWRVKDIGAMYFASMDIGLTKRDVFRFMCAYRGKSLRETLAEDADFWQDVQYRAVKQYNKLFFKDPEFPKRVGLTKL